MRVRSVTGVLLLLGIGGCGRVGYERVIEVPGESLPSAPGAGEGQVEPCGDFPFGDGVDGDAVVPEGLELEVNDVQTLQAPIAAGTLEIPSIPLLPLSRFRPGSVMMIWQTRVAEALPRGVDEAFDASAEPSLGHYELARVASVDAQVLTLCAPLNFDYDLGAQYVYVPQFRQVTVPTGAALLAPAWNGNEGGILALMANDAVSVDGTLSAQGAGFRGGAPQREGAAGEGQGSAFGNDVVGAGNNGLGGGGAFEPDQGGGGGAGVGAGGIGALHDSIAVPVAMGGQPVENSLGRLILGGGGGGGGNNNTAGTAGAAGGGIVWLRAPMISGTGTIIASGDNAQSLALGPPADGAGGGGGAGSIDVLTSSFGLSCGNLDARGGDGGESIGGHGAGGGGGGGLVRVQAPSLDAETCQPMVAGGPVGESGNAAKATPGLSGIAVVN